MTEVLILNGHPDPDPARFCAALAVAYADGAALGGHRVTRFDLGRLDLPMLRSRAAFEAAPTSADALALQEAIRTARHVVLIFPLWMGGAPALVRAFFEQTFRYGFAVDVSGKAPRRLLAGRSARLVVTMGMPAIFYRLMFGAFAVRAIERSILGLAGIGPVRRSLIGGIDGLTSGQRAGWLDRMIELGRRAR